MDLSNRNFDQFNECFVEKRCKIGKNRMQLIRFNGEFQGAYGRPLKNITGSDYKTLVGETLYREY
jgi:hypothetical protein